MLHQQGQSSWDEQAKCPVPTRPQYQFQREPNADETVRDGGTHHATMGCADSGEQPHEGTYIQRTLIHHQ